MYWWLRHENFKQGYADVCEGFVYLPWGDERGEYANGVLEAIRDRRNAENRQELY